MYEVSLETIISINLRFAIVLIVPLASTLCMGGAYPVYYNYDILVHHRWPLTLA